MIVQVIYQIFLQFLKYYVEINVLVCNLDNTHCRKSVSMVFQNNAVLHGPLSFELNYYLTFKL